jgi:hypothetical protein
MRPDQFAAPAGQPNRPMVEVLSIIIALSSTREDVTAPCGRPWMWFWRRYPSRTRAIARVPVSPLRPERSPCKRFHILRS